MINPIAILKAHYDLAVKGGMPEVIIRYRKAMLDIARKSAERKTKDD